jgi:hypothetical protein
MWRSCLSDSMPTFKVWSLLGVCKNAPLSFAMLVRIWILENCWTHFHEISYCEVLLKYVDRYQFCRNQTAITGTLHEYVDAFLSVEETVLGIPVWGIHSYLCTQREEFLVSFIPPKHVLLTTGDSDVSGAIFKSLCRHFLTSSHPKMLREFILNFSLSVHA